MFVSGYSLEIFKSKCDSNAKGVHCFVHLEDDISEVLKLLPKTNCRKCNEPTCMVFAARVADGVKNEKDCSEITIENKEKLEMYLSGFRFE